LPNASRPRADGLRRNSGVTDERRFDAPTVPVAQVAPGHPPHSRRAARPAVVGARDVRSGAPVQAVLNRSPISSARTDRIASLDLLRGLAAFAVTIPHYFELHGSHSDRAEVISVLAVEVFFTLSGFVLAPQILACMRGQRLADLRVFLV